jgi:hypothetical protein
VIGQAVRALLLSLFIVSGSTVICMLLMFGHVLLQPIIGQAFVFCSHAPRNQETLAFSCVDTPHGRVQAGDEYERAVQILAKDAWYQHVCLLPWLNSVHGQAYKGEAFLYGSRHKFDADVLFVASKLDNERRVIAEFLPLDGENWRLMGNQCWPDNIWASRWTRPDILIFVSGVVLMLTRLTSYRYAGHLAVLGAVMGLGAAAALLGRLINFQSI